MIWILRAAMRKLAAIDATDVWVQENVRDILAMVRELL